MHTSSKMLQPSSNFSTLRIVPNIDLVVVAHGHGSAWESAQDQSTRTALIQEFYDPKLENISCLRLVRFPSAAAAWLWPLGFTQGYATVTRLEVNCFVQDLGVIFALADSLPRLRTVVFGNDAIYPAEQCCLDSDFSNSWCKWQSKTGSVRQLKLVVDEEHAKAAKESIHKHTQFQLNTLFLLKQAREFFVGLRLVHLEGVPGNLEDLEWFGNKRPRIVYTLIHSPEKVTAYTPDPNGGKGRTIEIMLQDIKLLQYTLDLLGTRPVDHSHGMKRKAEEMETSELETSQTKGPCWRPWIQESCAGPKRCRN